MLRVRIIVVLMVVAVHDDGCGWGWILNIVVRKLRRQENDVGGSEFRGEEEGAETGGRVCFVHPIIA